ncbi:MAG: hypothetical protein EZS28_051966, partial [Streblomastix strix]
MDASQSDPLAALDIHALHSIIFPSQYLLSSSRMQLNATVFSSSSSSSSSSSVSSVSSSQSHFSAKAIDFATQSWSKFASRCRKAGQNKLATRILLRLMNIGTKISGQSIVGQEVQASISELSNLTSIGAQHSSTSSLTTGISASSVISNMSQNSQNKLNQSQIIQNKQGINFAHNRRFVRELPENEPFPVGIRIELQYTYIKDLLANGKITESEWRLDNLVKGTNTDRLNSKIWMQKGITLREMRERVHEEN